MLNPICLLTVAFSNKTMFKEVEKLDTILNETLKTYFKNFWEIVDNVNRGRIFTLLSTSPDWDAGHILTVFQKYSLMDELFILTDEDCSNSHFQHLNKINFLYELLKNC